MRQEICGELRHNMLILSESNRRCHVARKPNDWVSYLRGQLDRRVQACKLDGFNETAAWLWWTALLNEGSLTADAFVLGQRNPVVPLHRRYI